MTDNQEVKSADDIEKHLLEQAQAKVQDPIEAAAMMYGLYMPKFKQGLKTLGSRARIRVMNALIEYPLNERKYNHVTLLEKELMAIGHAVLEAKFVMIMATYNQNLDKLIKAADPDTDPDLTDDEKDQARKELAEHIETLAQMEEKENKLKGE